MSIRDEIIRRFEERYLEEIINAVHVDRIIERVVERCITEIDIRNWEDTIVDRLCDDVSGDLSQGELDDDGDFIEQVIEGLS